LESEKGEGGQYDSIVGKREKKREWDAAKSEVKNSYHRAKGQKRKETYEIKGIKRGVYARLLQVAKGKKERREELDES